MISCATYVNMHDLLHLMDNNPWSFILKYFSSMYLNLMVAKFFMTLPLIGNIHQTISREIWTLNAPKTTRSTIHNSHFTSSELAKEVLKTRLKLMWYVKPSFVYNFYLQCKYYILSISRLLEAATKKYAL